MTVDTDAIVAVTALVAVIVGPIISIVVVRKQINAQVVASNRQQWINELRSKIAGFLAEAVNLTWHPFDDQPVSAEAREKIELLTLLVLEIELYINPNDDDHRQLVDSLKRVARDAFSIVEGQKPESTFLGHEKAVIGATQKILKTEWERVKRGG